MDELKISSSARIKYLTALRNRCWKLLPIFEGKDIDGNIIYTDIEAQKNFSTNLYRLVVEIHGASKLWFEYPYFIELYNILNGIYDLEPQDIHHETIKKIVNHCTSLCEKMKEVN